MAQKTRRMTLLGDRARLQSMLQEYENSRPQHLSENERAMLIESIKRRLLQVNATLDQIENGIAAQ